MGCCSRSSGDIKAPETGLYAAGIGGASYLGSCIGETGGGEIGTAS
jgi:hypothetical protein